MKTLYVPEGFYTEPYTPSANAITSTKLSKTLKYVKFMISADADVSWVDAGGSVVTNFPIKGGIPMPFLVSKITSVSAGTVLIIHDGI